MIKKRMAGVIGACAMTISAGLFVASPAEAAACDIQIGRTHRSGNDIVGYGSLSNCPSSSRATVTIQWQRALDIWQDKASATVNGPGYDQYVRWNCAGSGTHTFRTIITGRTIGGTPKVKVSNTIRVSC